MEPAVGRTTRVTGFPSNRVGRRRGKSRLHQGRNESESRVATPCDVVCAEPPRKTSRDQVGIRTKTDTGRKVRSTKARERNLVKELGTLAP